MWPLSKAFCRIYQNDVFFAAFVVVALAVGFISAKVLIGKKILSFRCTRKVFIANF